MSDDLITVYRVGEDPIEVDPKKIVFTDRTRMETLCPRYRYIEYEYNGIGLTTSWRNEHLVIGSAVHEGIDLLLQGGTLEKALKVAEIDYLEAPDWSDRFLPEQKQIMIEDGLHLVKALIYAFNYAYVPTLLEEYELLEVEEETNWLLIHNEDEPNRSYIVVMSRPDAVWRKKSSGRLWHMSHKTLGRRFDDSQMDKLRVDIQRFTEGYAIWAKYGEPIEGTLYNYFLKGDTRLDEEAGVDRYTTGLIHPYLNRLALSGGDITPELLQFGYEWHELDQTTMKLKKRRLGKGWEKVDIYHEMDFLTYLEWLSQGLIQRTGRNYLAESVAGLVPVEWDRDHAERWAIGAAWKERLWHDKVEFLAGRWQDQTTYRYHEAQELPLESKECFAYNSKCRFYQNCWQNKDLQSSIDEGYLRDREPNHLVELRGRR